MPSKAYFQFQSKIISALVLQSFHGQSSTSSADQDLVNEACLKASIAQAVGCWEGYLEAVVREFVSTIRVQSHRNSLSIFAQFEYIVDKKLSAFNTPNWEKTRELLIEIAGLDPFASWIWVPKFSNQNDTKSYIDGILTVRHAFAHGFDIPAGVPGLNTGGVLDSGYASDAINCLKFFAETTDNLLEHELKHRHGCRAGWS